MVYFITEDLKHTAGDFNFWLSLSLSQFTQQNLKLNAKVPTYTRVQLNFRT